MSPLLHLSVSLEGLQFVTQIIYIKATEMHD